MKIFNTLIHKAEKFENKRRYGWKRDLPDQRDLLYKPLLTTTQLPPSVDLRSNCPIIQDQGNLGSCTAHALTAAVEFLEIKDKHPIRMLSRLFVYYNERMIEGTIYSDSGAALRDGVKALNKYGAPNEGLWGYNINVFTQKPNKQCYSTGAIHDIVQYKSLNNINDLKSCLASGFPFVMGFTVYESFESPIVASTGIVPMPQQNESVLGGHAVCVVGYDDSKQSFLVRNSWGTSWGLSGYFWLPYGFITTGLASDFWVISKTKSE